MPIAITDLFACAAMLMLPQRCEERGKGQTRFCLLQRMRRCGRPIDRQQHCLRVWKIYADKTFQPKASYQNAVSTLSA